MVIKFEFLIYLHANQKFKIGLDMIFLLILHLVVIFSTCQNNSFFCVPILFASYIHTYVTSISSPLKSIP